MKDCASDDRRGGDVLAGGAAVRFPVGGVDWPDNLLVPVAARGVVLFAPGGWAVRFDPLERAAAGALPRAELATLRCGRLDPDAAERRPWTARVGGPPGRASAESLPEGSACGGADGQGGPSRAVGETPA